MPATRIDDHIHMIELRPHGIKGFLSAYLLRGEEAAVIDPGPASSANMLFGELEKLGVDPVDVRYIVATHIHIDHAGGAGRLLKRLPKASLLVHGRGAPHMIDPTKLWQGALRALGGLAELYGEVEGTPRDRVTVAAEGMGVDLGDGVRLRVLETPGHASHCLSFFDDRSRGIFTGDAAGLYLTPPGVVLPTTPPPFFLDIALASIDKLIAAGPERIYYAHFGFTDEGLSRLKQHKQQLKLWFDVIAETADKGASSPEIYRKIEEEDRMVKMSREAFEGNPMFKGNLKLSIEGFLGYLERMRATRK